MKRSCDNGVDTPVSKRHCVGKTTEDVECNEDDETQMLEYQAKIKELCSKVLYEDDQVQHYVKCGLRVQLDDILITNGLQQFMENIPYSTLTNLITTILIEDFNTPLRNLLTEHPLHYYELCNFIRYYLLCRITNEIGMEVPKPDDGIHEQLKHVDPKYIKMRSIELLKIDDDCEEYPFSEYYGELLAIKTNLVKRLVKEICGMDIRNVMKSSTKSGFIMSLLSGMLPKSNDMKEIEKVIKKQACHRIAQFILSFAGKVLFTFFINQGEKHINVEIDDLIDVNMQ